MAKSYVKAYEFEIRILVGTLKNMEIKKVSIKHSFEGATWVKI